MITTFADMVINQEREKKRGNARHGSCGVGFHETIVRNQNVPGLKLTMGDLWDGAKRLPQQLEELCGKYSLFRTKKKIESAEAAIENFIKCCDAFAEIVNPAGIGQCKDAVFEGAQGLLLDQNNKTYFPHVTHSNTGMKNVDALLRQGGFPEPEIFYVSRTYLSRHGAGPLPGEDQTLSYEDETNQPHEFQGQIRFAPLDKELHARCTKDANGRKFKLALTHCDQKKPSVAADLYFEGQTRNSHQ